MVRLQPVRLSRDAASCRSASMVRRHLLVAARRPLLWLVAASCGGRIADALWLFDSESPHEFLDGEKLDMKVNKLISVKTQLPYDYYTLPFCTPDGGVEKTLENLGEVMAGDLVENTPYDLRMRENATCTLLCTRQLHHTTKAKIQEFIKNEYTVNFLVDDLPATTRYRGVDGPGELTEMTGFPVGVMRGHKYYLHNYLRLRIHYYAGAENAIDGYRIVGFEVEPQSLSPPPPTQACLDTQVLFGQNFIQIGKWRIASASDNLILQPANKGHVSSSANIFDSTMDLLRDDEIWSSQQIFNRPVGTLYDAQLGDRVLQLGMWRLGDLDGERFAISYERGGLVVFGSTTTPDNMDRGASENFDFQKNDDPRIGMALWDRALGAGTGIEYGDRFIQIGAWRIGEVAQYLTIAHKSGKKTYVFTPFWSNTPKEKQCQRLPCIAKLTERINYGLKMFNRVPVPAQCNQCNWRCFIDRYPHVREIVGNDFEQAEFHYQKYGKKQHLDCTCAPRSRPESVCQAHELQPLDLERQDEVHFMYDVSWEESSIRWVSRWDAYMAIRGGKIHWFAILNSVVVTLFLSGVMAIILLRTLFRDIARYNEYGAEDSGWKLVHGDVFRKPQLTRLLAGSVGCGVQILGMSILTLIVAVSGVLSPSHRGAILQSMMFFFTIMGVPAGFTSAWVYKLFQGQDWQTTKLMTAMFYPGIAFFVFFMLNLLVWSAESSGAVPISTMCVLLFLWFGMSVPLVLLGLRRGQDVQIELPVKTQPVIRQIPEQSWLMHPAVLCALAGLVPFGSVFTELHFILSSLWLHQFYYLFGFLALVLLILMITCAEISIALTYFRLAMENHRWCWSSFLASGTSGGYFFAYSTYYFHSGLEIESVVSTILYFGYMGIASMFFSLMTGSMGFLASAYFVRQIYGSIKVD
eukprot:TRINITY_DN22948_c0_g1_i1.p1 TRINITY_DN22948_c0_g1~~TRINITY_DN22948_c0_g1_i1.p1  ORF type:complete len:918 (-),score=129.39 TRINITY_DN22948_c0_g1_i1:39-2792(-)